jgi:cytochrome oxidase Cu insertion factor (SCO1/SenC/PrrC family)
MRAKLFATTVAIFLLLSGCLDTEQESPFFGKSIEGDVGFNEFILTDENGTSFNSSSVEGNVLVIGFIFTNCPDKCITVSQNMKYLYDGLNQSNTENVSFISITVDPWRDSSSLLANYSQSNYYNWTHLTITSLELDQLALLESVWADFNIGVVLTEEGEENTSGRGHSVNYEVEHSLGIVMVDKLGIQKVRWTEEDWISPEVEKDLLYLLQ